jgi:hypothetical protein
MRFPAAGYENADGKFVSTNRFDKEPQNHLLHEVILAFIKTIQNDDWKYLRSWDLLEGLHDQPRKLELDRPGDNEAIPLDSVLHGEKQPRHRMSELVCKADQ